MKLCKNCEIREVYIGDYCLYCWSIQIRVKAERDWRKRKMEEGVKQFGRSKHYKEALARCNRATLDCAIDNCRMEIEDLLLVKFNEQETKKMMEYIDHLCNFCVVRSAEMAGHSAREAVGDILVG